MVTTLRLCGLHGGLQQGRRSFRLQPDLGSSTQDTGEGLWFYIPQENIFQHRLWFMHVKLSLSAAPMRVPKRLGLSLPLHPDGDEREMGASQLRFSRSDAAAKLWAGEGTLGVLFSRSLVEVTFQVEQV